MSQLTHEEALAFIEAMQLTLRGKVGYAWLVAKLSLLAEYVEAIGIENDRLRAALAEAGTDPDGLLSSEDSSGSERD